MTNKTATKSTRRFARTPAEPTPPDAPSAVAQAVDPSPRPESKIAQVIRLLERDAGASLDEMVKATGWLPHTNRAALTGLKKKGHVITKGKRGDVTCYFIVSTAA